MLDRRSFIKAGAVLASAVAGRAWKLLMPSDGSVAEAEPLLASCVLTPELTEGPYYIAKEKVRKNIREKRAGTPLELRFTVVDATTCKPIKNAAVDIWHCDAGGIYSGFEAASTGGPGGGSGPTDKDTFCRGIQLTDAKGVATFKSVYPGWYRGRTVHIHVKVHLGGKTVGNVVHTGQIFFNDSFTSKVYQASPYASRAASRDTLNSGDSIYQQGGKQSTPSVKKDGKGGYIGTITMGVRT
jgi:protocatechuate 3,4-dioxygenase beta subunit